MQVNKKGSLETKEIIELLLAAAGIFILVVLLYNILAPDFDKDEETAESYFNSLMDEIDVASSGGTGEFSMWLPEEEKGTHFYVVYFGSRKYVDLNDEVTFASVGFHDNRICVCYVKDEEANCDFCKNLDYPLEGLAEGSIIKQGENLELTKSGGSGDEE